MNTPIEVKCGLQGFYRITKHKGDADGNPIPGTEELVCDWFENLITNSGKNLFTDYYYLDYCRVGTGNTAPSVGDTALVNQVGITNTVQANARGAQGTAPYFGWYRKTFRFATGTAAGNLAEVGVGNNLTLFSRALIVDGLGAPTTITVLSDEVLDVTYELRVYPILTDLPGNIILEGVDRATVLRAALVTDVTWWCPVLSNFVVYGFGNYGSTSDVTVYSGAATLGPITSTPTQGSGGQTLLNYSTLTVQPYLTNTFYRDFKLSFGLNTANTALPIGALLLTVYSSFAFQISFNPGLVKTASKVLNLTFRFSWDRYTPP